MKIGDRLFFSGPEMVKLSPRITTAVNHKIIEIKGLKKANIKDIIYNTTGFEPIKTNKNCGGFFNQHDKVIAINPNEVNPFKIFCHELGHFIHTDLGVDTYKTNLLSYQVELEQEAEAVGMRVYEAVTGEKYNSKTYFSKEDIKWLADWYTQWGWHENDLTLN